MTDLLDRPGLEVTEDTADLPPPAVKPDHKRVGTGRPVHTLLAVLLGATAVLLFTMSSTHLSGRIATVGGAAAVAAVVLAFAVLSHPSRAVFASAAVLNLAVVAFWLVAHGRGVSTTVVAIGVTWAALSAVVAALVAVRAAVGTHWSSPTMVFGSIVPLAVVVITIAALFSTPATATSGTNRSSNAPSATPGGSAAALALAGTVKVPGENSKTFQSVIAGNSTEQSELQKWVPLDPATQALLSQQLAQAYEAAMRYPTVASAKAAGMILAGGMAPGVGAHYQIIGPDLFKGINPDGTVNPLYPASWIYASTADNAPVVGVMYESLASSAPAGFAGPNDHWHRHSNVCVQFGGGKIAVPFAADQDVTPQECRNVHGTFMNKTVWMVHAWVVPGWESPQGVFSHDNLHVYCPGNTDLTDAIGFCVRQS